MNTIEILEKLCETSDPKYFDELAEEYQDIMKQLSIILLRINKGNKPLSNVIVKHLSANIGRIRLGQNQRAKSYPYARGFEQIAAWSRGKTPWKELSPFFIGPVEFINFEGKKDESPIFENFWQSFKAWEIVKRQSTKNWKYPEKRLMKDGKVLPEWYLWHDKLIHHDMPVRRPNGREIPKYAWWRDEDGSLHKLDVIGARRKIYIPYLKALYRASPVYKKLLKKIRNGKDLMIIEPDGPWLDLYPSGMEVNLPLLYSMIDKRNYKDEGHPEKYFPYGHGYVLASTLLEDAI